MKPAKKPKKKNRKKKKRRARKGKKVAGVETSTSPPKKRVDSVDRDIATDDANADAKARWSTIKHKNAAVNYY